LTFIPLPRREGKPVVGKAEEWLSISIKYPEKAHFMNMCYVAGDLAIFRKMHNLAIKLLTPITRYEGDFTYERKAKLTP
jgi:hypothetical protein